MAKGSSKKKSPPRKRTTSRSRRPVPRRRGVVILMLVLLAIVGGAAGSQVWTRLRALDSGYKLTEVNAEHRRLLEVNRQLKIELTLLKNPARIKRIATRKLGMSPPRPHQVRKLVDRNRRAAEGDRRLAKADNRGRRNGS